MTTKQFQLINRHGQRLIGEIDYPPEIAQVRLTLVLCHGFGGTRHGRHLLAIAGACVAVGAAVVRFDFTNGAGESDGELADGSVTGYVDDLEDVLTFLKQQPRLTDSAIAIGGHSYAGMVILVVAARLPQIAGVFFLSGVFDRTDDFDIPALTRQITAPIYVIHGDADREVALSHPERLRAVAGDKITRWLILPGVDHNYAVGGSALMVANEVSKALGELMASRHP